MTFLRREYSEILDSALRQLTAETNITQLSPGAKARTVLEITSRQVSEQYQVFDANLAMAFISSSRGEALDLMGELVGLQRLQPTAASTISGSETVIFYTEAGNFGEINGGGDITIPKGTRLFTSPSAPGAEDGITYYISEETDLPAAARQQAVPVAAAQQGNIYNVGKDSLVNHEFTNYVEGLSNTLLVRNQASITTGRNVESDADFRYRISRQVTASERANETAIRLASLSVPGVADIVTVPYIRGLGTYGVFVKSVDARVSDDLVAAVQVVLDIVQSYGNRGFALAPKEIGMEMDLTLTFRETITSKDQADISRGVVSTVYDYINNLQIGEDFIINELVQRVMSVDDRIRNLGEANQPIDDLKAWRTSRTADNRVRYTLNDDYIAAFDEKVLIEYSLAEPVRVFTE